MENKQMSKVKDFSNLSKESRIVLFLQASQNKTKNEIKNLYINTYKLNAKSSSINMRVIERFLGVYTKYSKEVKAETVKVLKAELTKVKVNYSDLIKLYKEVKEKSKRSNRLSNFKEIKIEL